LRRERAVVVGRADVGIGVGLRVGAIAASRQKTTSNGIVGRMKSSAANTEKDGNFAAVL